MSTRVYHKQAPPDTRQAYIVQLLDGTEAKRYGDNAQAAGCLTTDVIRWTPAEPPTPHRGPNGRLAPTADECRSIMAAYHG